MSSSRNAASTRAAGTSSVVVEGYGVELRVDRGALVLRSGIADRRQERRVYRSDRTVRRIVVLSSTGTVTLGALRWCADVGIAVVCLDPTTCEVLAINAPRIHDDARLRRSQAMSSGTVVGLEAARGLITAKVEGQLRVLKNSFGDAEAIKYVTSYFAELRGTDDLDRLRALEANAAAMYFKAWAGVPIRFESAHAERVPPGWLQFDQRTSGLTDGHAPRGATNPINALLNYAYRLLEVEAVLACHALGLDPGLGVLHRDKKGRDSLALDLLEPVRPAVDSFVLDLVRTRTFTRDDFTETRDGQCRVLPPVAVQLITAMPQWASDLAPHAENVAHLLTDAASGVARRRTPLTGKARSSPRRPTRQASVAAPPRCTSCGGELGDRRRAVCPACFAASALDRAREQARAARERLASLPAGASADARRGAKVSANRAENALWDTEYPDGQRDPEYYRRQILGGLAAVPVRTIAENLGVAYDAAWRMRRGELVPHARHWPKLEALGCRQPPE